MAVLARECAFLIAAAAAAAALFLDVTSGLYDAVTAIPVALCAVRALFGWPRGGRRLFIRRLLFVAALACFVVYEFSLIAVLPYVTRISHMECAFVSLGAAGYLGCWYLINLIEIGDDADGQASRSRQWQFRIRAAFVAILVAAVIVTYLPDSFWSTEDVYKTWSALPAKASDSNPMRECTTMIILKARRNTMFGETRCSAKRDTAM